MERIKQYDPSTMDAFLNTEPTQNEDMFLM